MSVTPPPKSPHKSGTNDEHHEPLDISTSYADEATIPFDSTIVAKDHENMAGNEHVESRPLPIIGAPKKPDSDISANCQAHSRIENAAIHRPACHTDMTDGPTNTEPSACLSEGCECGRRCHQLIVDMRREFAYKLNAILTHLQALRAVTSCKSDQESEPSKELGKTLIPNAFASNSDHGIGHDGSAGILATTPSNSNSLPEGNFSSAYSSIGTANWADAADTGKAGPSGVTRFRPAGQSCHGGASPSLNSSKLPLHPSGVGLSSVPGRHSSQKKRKSVTIADSTEAGEAKKLKTNLYPDIEKSSDLIEAHTHGTATCERIGNDLDGIEQMEDKPSDDATEEAATGNNDGFFEAELDHVVTRNKHGRQVTMQQQQSGNMSASNPRNFLPASDRKNGQSTSIRATGTGPMHAMPKQTTSYKRVTSEKVQGSSGATPASSSKQKGREWAMTKEQHERRRASDLSTRFQHINKRAQTLIIGDSHMHGLRGSEISSSVHFMVSGGLCYTATARCLSEVRESFQNFRMLYIALGTNDILHHSNEEIRAGLAFLLEQVKRVFPSAKVEFILPFVSPKLLSLGFQTDEYLTLLQSVVGPAVIHHNVDLAGHFDYFATNSRKPGPAVHLKREHGIGLMVNLIKGIMGIQQPIHKTKLFNMPAPTPKKNYWDRASRESQNVRASAGVDLSEDFPALLPSKVNLDSLSVGQLLKALELASHF